MQAQAPFWWPDGQGFVIAAVVVYAGIALFYRMTHPVEVNDKLLDMMLTILYGTAFVGILNFVIGSSRSSQVKDVATNKIVEKLTGGDQSIKPPVVVAWWGTFDAAEQAALISAAATDPKVQTFIDAAKGGKATPEDLAYLVSKIPPLLTQARADAIAAT